MLKVDNRTMIEGRGWKVKLKVVTGMVLTLLLASWLVTASSIVPTRADSECIRVPEDYPTIQEAIDEANPGDTIIVSEGMYAEGPIFITKSLTITADGHVEVDGLGNGSVFTVSADNVTIKGFTVKHSGLGWARSGILLNRVQDCIIEGNTATNCSSGISLVFSHRNEVKENTATKNNINGIYVRWSNWNEIEENNVSDNGVLPASGRGMLLERSNGNVIRRNTANNNFWTGILLMFYNDENMIEENTAINNRNGIYLGRSNNNLIVGNVLRQNHWAGIKLRLASNNNLIVGNTITDAYPLRGIFISAEGGTVIEPIFEPCEGNLIYHNNLINNRYQVYNYMSNSTWDNEYPSGGNYWSDYTGSDLYSGPFQNETGSDGVGDTPYIIDEYNRDRYPLMEPWGSAIGMMKSLVRTIRCWDLGKGTEKALTSKLEDAIHLVNQGNVNGAIHKLMDLMSQVEAMRGKKLTDEQADYLISEAQRIIDLINN